MKEYYIAKGNEKLGAFSLEELKSQTIYSDTLIWKEGWENWKEASEVAELETIVRNSPPPIPQKSKYTEVSHSADKNRYDIYEDEIRDEHYNYDYSEIEDIAGVDYKKAIYITAAYIGINLFFREYAVLGSLGIIISTGLVVAIWFYFKKYFDAMEDFGTSRWLQWIIGAYVVFGLANLYTNLTLSFYSVPDIIDPYSAERMARNSTLAYYGILAAMFIVFISGFKIISVSNRHPFPLKRIAVSTMILGPAYMIVSIFENMPLIHQITWLFGDDGFELPFFFCAVFMLPYFFLLQHFYRADKYDATPDDY
ncbi:MAG: DUF4339 domain-containing protein [Bacteroidota bacterium]